MTPSAAVRIGADQEFQCFADLVPGADGRAVACVRAALAVAAALASRRATIEVHTSPRHNSCAIVNFSIVRYFPTVQLLFSHIGRHGRYDATAGGACPT